MLTVTIDNGNGPPQDVSNYVVEGSLSIQDQINVPAIINLTLANVDDAMAVPLIGSYISIYSTKYEKYLATGFVTSEPQRSFLGLSQRVPSKKFQHYEYTIAGTSDEWLLNVKAVPFIPAFIGRTMGQILSALANLLAPNFYDTSQIQDGPVVPYFQYTPTQKWSDLAKQFADQSRYRYKAVNRVITFAPYGDAPLGVSYDDTGLESTFDPSILDSSILTVPPVNDAIVVGAAEPHVIHDDYFVGDGFSSNYPLRHAVFDGATNALLEDDWTEAVFNTSLWTVQDPGDQFLLSSDGVTPVGALNVVAPASASGNFQFGQEYILSTNGVELGGHLVLQHGDFTFVDAAQGIIGGVYSDALLAQASCLLGFMAFTASGDLVVPSPSGAQNVSLQPIVSGAQVGPILKTKVNHQYVLNTYIDARRYTRSNLVFNSLTAAAFGGNDLASLADVTFTIQDIDQTQPWNPPVITQYQLIGIPLPSFAFYAVINSIFMNLNVNFTLINAPPQGRLTVAGLTGATGSQLPLHNPQPPQQCPLGFGIQGQVATITQGQNQDADVLSFYAGQILQAFVPVIGGVSTTLVNSTIPAPGARIALRSWESARSMARVRDQNGVNAAAVVEGDDGVRTGVFMSFNPLPRTSEECELAALAVMADQEYTQYQGSYGPLNTANLQFWNGYAADYPYTGRFLNVNSPQRNILNKSFLATQVTTQVVEMHDEIIEFTISFGMDPYLDKMLARFLPGLNPQNTLEPNDAAVTPTLQFINNVGTLFLEDLNDAQATTITGTSVTIDLGSPPVTGCEVRRADYGWGTSDQNLVGVFTTQQFTIPRTSYEQVFYMRMRNGAQTSRRTHAIRVVYPLVPTSPGLAGIGLSDPFNPVVEMQFTGDIRNIRGLEIRDADNATVLVQQTILSIADLNFTYANVEGKTNINLYAYFFNLLWEYSTPLVVNISIPIPLLVPQGVLGANLLGNPGFEVQSANYPASAIGGSGQYLADGWLPGSDSDARFSCAVPTGDGLANTGNCEGLISLSTGVLIAASGTIVGTLESPCDAAQNAIAVRGGQYYYFGGYARWDAPGGALPAGVSATVFFRLNFYKQDGTYLSSEVSTALASSGGGYTYLDGLEMTPDLASYAIFECVAQLHNSNSSPFNTGALSYLNARFDDVLLEVANRGSHATYRPLSNPLTAMDDGSVPEIDVASFTMRSGGTDVVVNAGSVMLTSSDYLTTFYVYYDDPAFVGGNVTFHVSTVKETALIGENRFYVGAITTPAKGAAPTGGKNDGGSGAQFGYLTQYFFGGAFGGTTAPSSTPTGILSVFGNGTLVNGPAIGDGDFSTACTLIVSGNSSAGNDASVTMIGFPAPNVAWESLEIHTIYDVPVNTLNGTGFGRFEVQFTLANGFGPVGVSTWPGAAGATTGQVEDFFDLLSLATYNQPSPPNASTISASAGARTQASDTTGVQAVRVYEIWVEGVF